MENQRKINPQGSVSASHPLNGVVFDMEHATDEQIILFSGFLKANKLTPTMTVVNRRKLKYIIVQGRVRSLTTSLQRCAQHIVDADNIKYRQRCVYLKDVNLFLVEGSQIEMTLKNSQTCIGTFVFYNGNQKWYIISDSEYLKNQVHSKIAEYYDTVYAWCCYSIIQQEIINVDKFKDVTKARLNKDVEGDTIIHGHSHNHLNKLQGAGRLNRNEVNAYMDKILKEELEAFPEVKSLRSVKKNKLHYFDLPSGLGKYGTIRMLPPSPETIEKWANVTHIPISSKYRTGEKETGYEMHDRLRGAHSAHINLTAWPSNPCEHMHINKLGYELDDRNFFPTVESLRKKKTI